MRTEHLSRRGILHGSFALGIAATSGCLFASSGPGPGALVIYNERGEQHTVSVRLEKTSTDTGNVRHSDQTPAPGTTPLWKREETFTIEGESRLVKNDYITERGAYFVDVRSQNGEHPSNWIRVSGGVNGGIASGYVVIRIQDDGRLVVQQGARV